MTFRTINPTNNKEIKSFDLISDEQMEEKIKKGNEVYLKWKITDFAHRSDLMRKAGDILKKNAEDYGKLVTMEMGKPLKQAKAEIEKCGWVCFYYAENAEKMLSDEDRDSAASSSVIQYDPLGVIYAIMPWNFPFWQVLRFAAPALMAGNAALLKHAENVPQCAEAIEDVFRKAGFPEGLFQNMFISHGQSDKLIANPLVKGVTLTGSGVAGSHVAGQAGKALKKHVLELGGSDPFIVLPGADLDKAAATGVKARTMNAGQSCIAAKRFILHKDIAVDFLERFKRNMAELKIGEPMQDVDMGPMARPDLLDNIHDQVVKSVDMGAELVMGGHKLDREGCFYAPTIIKDPPKDSPAYKEELFGPAAVIFEVSSEEEAIRIANDTEFGLGASIWTDDIAKAKEMSHRIEAGNVFINDMVKSDPRLPFGGIKNSGYGRELSDLGIHEFVNIKTVYIA